MKKTYQNPTTKIVKIQTIQMIAASPAAPSMVGKDATGTAMSRKGGWNDDEEDDYDE